MNDENSQQQEPRRRAEEDAGREPTQSRPLNQCEHDQRDPEGDAERTGQVELTPSVALSVLGDQHECEEQGRTCQCDIDQEHRFPAEGACQQSPEEHADHQSGRPGAAPDSQRAVTYAAFDERDVDERQRGGKDQRATEALNRASGEKHPRPGRQSARKRCSGVEDKAGGQDPASPDEVCGASAEQQKTRGGDCVGTDHRLECLRGIAQVARDVGQRHDDDVLVERDDQHGERQQRECRCLTVPAEAALRRRSDRCHSSTPRRSLASPLRAGMYHYAPEVRCDGSPAHRLEGDAARQR